MQAIGSKEKVCWVYTKASLHFLYCQNWWCGRCFSKISKNWIFIFVTSRTSIIKADVPITPKPLIFYLSYLILLYYILLYSQHIMWIKKRAFSCLTGSHSLKASRSGYQIILCCSGTSDHGFRSLKIVKRSVGWFGNSKYVIPCDANPWHIAGMLNVLSHPLGLIQSSTCIASWKNSAFSKKQR